MSEPFLVVVSAGTYHLPFHRLIDWTAAWLRDRPEVEAIVQHGTSRPLPGAHNVEMLPHGELLEIYARASAIVLQGGAGGVMDARQLGRTPIVVPRVPVDDEVVDNHQVVFAQRLEELGLVRVALTMPRLHELLDQAYANPTAAEGAPAVATPGVGAVAERLQAPGAPRGKTRPRLLADVLRPGLWAPSARR